MATAVATVVVRLAAIEVAVEVTTDCRPPTSLVMRDCTSPVRVLVKKAMDWRCRWVKTSVRSRCITCWPTRVLTQVWTTPSAAVSAATATMPPVSTASRGRSRLGSAVSITARSRNGEAMPSTDETTMIAVTPAIAQRWGRKRRPMRRSETPAGLRLLGGGDGAAAAARRGGGRPRGLLSTAVDIEVTSQ